MLLTHEIFSIIKLNVAEIFWFDFFPGDRHGQFSIWKSLLGDHIAECFPCIVILVCPKLQKVQYVVVCHITQTHFPSKLHAGLHSTRSYFYITQSNSSGYVFGFGALRS